jgi:hypothetical protein
VRATGMLDDFSDDEVKELLLDAAELIRALRIAMGRRSSAPSAEPHPAAPYE